MNKKLVCIAELAFLILLAAGCSKDKTSAAQTAANDWLKLVDSGNYAQSWEEAANLMKSAVAKEQWQQIMTLNRAPLGTPLSRKLTSAQYTEDLPGAPAGRYVVLEYETAFQNAKSATENATGVLDKDGRWRVSVYYIR